MTNSMGKTPPIHNRTKLVRAMNQLSSSQLEELREALNIPSSVVSKDSTPQANKVLLLIAWIEKYNKASMSEVQPAIEQILESQKKKTEEISSRKKSIFLRGSLRRFRASLKKIEGILSLMGTIVTILGIVTIIPEIKKYIDSSNLSQQQAGKEIQTYRLISHPVEINHPKNWVVQRVDDPIDDTVLKIVPQSLEGEAAKPEVVLTIEDISQNPISLQEQILFVESTIKNNVDNGKIVQKSTETFINRPGYKVIYTGKIGDKIIKAMRVGAFSNYKLYEFTYIAPSKSYENHADEASLIFKSARLTNN